MNFKLMSISLFAAIISANANATTVIYKDFNHLVDESEHVVGGTVAKLQAKKYKGGEIYTVITLKKSYLVTASGQQATAKPITLRYKGGEVDVRGKNGEKSGVEGVHVNGAPEFNIGERVLLFVNKNGIADMPIYGWKQGVFRIGNADEVMDAKNQPVIGLDGADIIVKTDNGLVSKNKSKKTTKASKEVSKAILLKSVGGKDVVVSSARNNRAVQDKLSAYSAMHISNFLSMVQERKASKAVFKRTDKNSLFSLPAIASSSVAKSERAKTQKKIPLNQQGTINKKSVDPLRKPTRNVKGK